MRIRSEADTAADEESRFWTGLAVRWRELSIDDLAATEAGVVRFHDPRRDLQRRSTTWGYPLGAGDLADVARFAGALARAEAEAWRADEPHVATRALEERRFLIGDRIVHWAVPYIDAVGRCYPDLREFAHRDRDGLLSLAERMRLAPALVGREGVAVPGEDAFGPMGITSPAADHLLSVWSGLVVLRATLTSMLGRPLARRHIEEDWLIEPEFRTDLCTLYEVAGRRWEALAEAYPGSARLWSDLAERAHTTTAALALP